MQGLQCFDANGNLILDITDRLTRVLGEFDTGLVNGSLNDDGLRTGTPWYNIYYTDSIYKIVPVVIWIGDNELIWTFTRTDITITNLHIIYGVY